jgi:hypothetical protein
MKEFRLRIYMLFFHILVCIFKACSLGGRFSRVEADKVVDYAIAQLDKRVFDIDLNNEARLFHYEQ